MQAAEADIASLHSGLSGLTWTEIQTSANGTWINTYNVKAYYCKQLDIVRVCGYFAVIAGATHQNSLFGVDSKYVPAHSVCCQMFNSNNFKSYDMVLIGMRDNADYGAGNVRIVDNLALPFPVNMYVDFSYKLK